MADTGGIRAGRAFVEIGADRGLLDKALKASLASLKNFADAALGITGQLAKGAVDLGKSWLQASIDFADAGAELLALSKQTGLAVEELSRLQYLAGRTGVNFGSVVSAVRVMEKTIGGAAAGSESAQKKLAKLGLTLQDVQGLDPAEQFQIFAAAVNQGADQSERLARAMNAFGKGGAALLPMLEQSAEQTDALSERAERLGLIWTGPEAEGARALKDALFDLQAVGTRLWQLFGEALAPALTDLAKFLADNAGWITTVAKNFGVWVASLWQAAGGIGLLNSALDALETVAATVVAAFMDWQTILTRLPVLTADAMDVALAAVQWFADNFTVILDNAISHVAGSWKKLVAGFLAGIMPLRGFLPEAQQKALQLGIHAALIGMFGGETPGTVSPFKLTGTQAEAMGRLGEVFGIIGTDAAKIKAGWQVTMAAGGMVGGGVFDRPKGAPPLWALRALETKDAAARAAAGIDETMRKAAVAGTFNPFAVRGLGVAGGPLDKIEKNTKHAADTLDEIQDELAGGGILFG